MEDPEDLDNQSVLDEENEKVTQLFEDDMSYYANADHVVFVIHVRIFINKQSINKSNKITIYKKYNYLKSYIY